MMFGFQGAYEGWRDMVSTALDKDPNNEAALHSLHCALAFEFGRSEADKLMKEHRQLLREVK